MVTSPNISPDVARDIEYGQLVMLVTTPDDDVKGNIDIVIGSLRVAWRKRRVRLAKYRQISIRHSRNSGVETERDKILSGKCKSSLFIFEFIDCYVLCRLRDIRNYLENFQGEVVPNQNGKTKACYINVNELPNLIVQKDSTP